MEAKKIVVSPNNLKAIAFFEDLNNKKQAMFKRIDNMQLAKLVNTKKSR